MMKAQLRGIGPQVGYKMFPGVNVKVVFFLVVMEDGTEATLWFLLWSAAPPWTKRYLWELSGKHLLAWFNSMFVTERFNTASICVKICSAVLDKSDLMFMFWKYSNIKTLHFSWRIEGFSFRFLHHLQDMSCLKASCRSVLVCVASWLNITREVINYRSWTSI